MPLDASIAMSVQDNLSAAIVSMRNSMTAYRADVVELQKELYSLSNTKASLRVDMNAAQIQLKKTRQAYKDLGDEATEAERKAAEADWRQAEENLDNIRQQYELFSKQVKQTTRDIETASGAISRMENRAGGPGSTGIFSALGKAGIMNMVGDAASQWANVMVGSTLGSSAGSLFSSALSGAASGAAMGSLLGAPGMAVGAAIGGGVGLLSGSSQVFQERDEAFKAYYSGIYDAQSQAVLDNQAAGSATASQRQQDAIAFNKLLGQEAAGQYLSDLRTMAADTPLEYSDLTTMSRALATGFSSNPDRMLALMTGIGNAGSAVGVDASGMATMAQALSRMQSSGKTSLEYLNMFQERGIDVIGMLASSLGVSQGQVYEMISDGDISGTKAVDIIQQGLEQYAGAMEEMSKTFEGRTSTLSDTMAEIYNAGGETYNQSRTEAMALEIETYGGALGEAMKEAYAAIGDGQAALENLGEAYTRDALSAVLQGGALTQEWDETTAAKLAELSGEYQSAMADYKAGNEAAGVKIDDIISTAEGLAQQQFEASELYRANQEAEENSLEALRDNTAAVTAAANAYRTAQERTKGLGYNFASSLLAEDGSRPLPQSTSGSGHAYGLARVPRNGLYYLHQDERVQTAQEARSDRNVRPIQITITGNNFGAGATAEEIAQRLADSIERKMAAGVLS